MKRRPLLVPADVYRPAAIQQLKTLGTQLDVSVFDSRADQDRVQIAKYAVSFASSHGFDTVVIDTAGRLQVDQELMNELLDISDAGPQRHEVLLVVFDVMTGQEAVNVAKGFDATLDSSRWSCAYQA